MCTNSLLPPPFGLKRMPARRAWKASQFEHEEISRNSLLGRQPHFQVVGLRGRKAHVAGAKQDRAVMQAELLQNRFRIGYQGFVLLVAFIGMREFEEFHFLKLVLAQDAPRVFPRGAGFGTETCCPGRDVNGKLVFGQCGVAVEVVQFHLRRRRQPEIRVLRPGKDRRRTSAIAPRPSRRRCSRGTVAGSPCSRARGYAHPERNSPEPAPAALPSFYTPRNARR